MSDAFQTHGAFSWSELQTNDVERAKAFYTEVVGWEIEEMEMPVGKYTVLKAGGQPVGGIMQTPAEAGDAPPHWGTFVTVDDVDARTEKARAAGASIMMPPMDIPGVGRFSVLQDPTGASIALITYEQKDA